MLLGSYAGSEHDVKRGNDSFRSLGYVLLNREGGSAQKKMLNDSKKDGDQVIISSLSWIEPRTPRFGVHDHPSASG
jgi:hypothetical protein